MRLIVYFQSVARRDAQFTSSLDLTQANAAAELLCNSDNQRAFEARFAMVADSNLLSIAYLRASIEHAIPEVLLSNSSSSTSAPISFTYDDALLICHRTKPNSSEASATSSPPSIAMYSICSDSDTSQLSDDDHLYVFPRPLARSGVEPSTFAISLHKLVTNSLPKLSQLKNSNKTLSKHAQLLREYDEVRPCVVPRSDETFLQADIVSAAKQIVSQQDSDSKVKQFAIKLRHSFATEGFLRVKFDAKTQDINTALLDMQQRFFKLSPQEKLKWSAATQQGFSANYQPSFGYVQSKTCNKEYFVVRQPLVSDATSHVLPSEPLDFNDKVWAMYWGMGDLCKEIMIVLLYSLDVGLDATNKVIEGSMKPPRSQFEFGCTSVIELFHYQSIASTPTQTNASVVAGNSTASAGSSTVDIDALPPPISCSIHTDASLLTIVPRCVGPAGLQAFQWKTGEWCAVEEQSSADSSEAIVMSGDMLARLLNHSIEATLHRVVFDQSAISRQQQGDMVDETSNHRFSTPFELFLEPSYVVDCQKLLASSLQQHFNPPTICAECLPIQTAQEASYEFSKQLVSVNKADS